MEEKKANMQELSMDEMDKVSGGGTLTVQGNGATVRNGPGKGYASNGKLTAGTQVNFTGTLSYNDKEGRTYYMIDSPLYGWVLGKDLGL